MFFWDPDTTCLGHLADGFSLGLLPPPSNHLLSVQGHWITGLVSPLSKFSTFCTIKLFSAKYSNLFHVRCLAVLETQEPLGGTEGPGGQSDLELLKTRPQHFSVLFLEGPLQLES